MNENINNHILENAIINEYSHYMFILASISLIIISSILFIIFLSKKRNERVLKAQINELRILNNSKDKFFSIIAHDLKSPFSSLMGFSEMLMLNAETNNPAEVIEHSKIVHNSSKRLFGLVENLLQWSRTQLGTEEYYPEKLDISLQTQNVISLLKLNAEEKDIVISQKTDNIILAWADANLYSSVLRNLISNAIKFSKVGSVIYVNVHQKNGMIEVSVTDTGIGIRKENQEKLFNIDTTISTNGTFEEKGTGLGLMLCKEFVKINKGSIHVESELEKGSTFYFTLPLYKASEKAMS